MKYKDIINKMTLEEKAMLCVGQDYWNSKGLERLGIPSIKMSDGPHGLRVQKTKADNLGINKSEVSTCFPSGATIANSWDKQLAYKMGKTIGEEAVREEVDIVLGPGVNIKRSPLCGRNFEYFSEDPFLSGKIGAEYVKGMQENGVGACVKHFAANNQENRRRTINTVIDERTLREIYLKPFEIIVKDAQPWAVMSAYNKINGEYCTENKKIIDILKNEWNFDGIVITDWGAENDRVKGLLAGNELEMPGGRGNGINEIIEAVKEGKVKEEYLDNIVDRILRIVFKAKKDKKIDNYTQEEHHRIAEEIAENSIVLLKNENNILPLRKQKIAIIGDMAENPRYQGAGSSTINPYKIENAIESFKNENIDIEYAQGYNRIEKNKEEEEKLQQEAIKIAKVNDVVLIFAGLTENYESEGMDRTILDIPNNQNNLIDKICEVNQNVVIVLSNGAPIAMPWKDKVKGIITGYLGGEAGAKAMVKCLIGKVNPSGKLAETYPLRIEDTPCFKNFPGTEVSVEYQEAIYVGYRYYDKANKEVLFPFGFGMSYTQFEYKNLKVTNENDKFNIEFYIKNVGKCDGKEIAQIYIKQENPNIFKPRKELKEFVKLELKKGEEKKVTITLDRNAFEYFNPETKKWSVEQGRYKILIGASSRDIKLEADIELQSNDLEIKEKYPKAYIDADIQNITDKDFETILGAKIPDRELKLEDMTDENTLEQIKNTKVGKYIYENEMQRMQELLDKQDVNKATKVMMDIQKPLKKFYEKKSSGYTKKMVDELLDIAKNNKDNIQCEFINKYLQYILKNIKAVFIDIDGTTLNDDEKITEKTKNAIHECRKKGIRIIIASGRSTNATLKLQEEFNTSPYLISSNGAAAFDVVQKQEILSNEMEKDGVLKLLGYAQKNNYKISLQYGQEVALNEAFYEDEKKMVKDNNELIEIINTKKIIQCVMCNRNFEKMYEIEKFVQGISNVKIVNKSKRMSNPDLLPSKSYYCDITSVNSTKGNAVDVVSKYLGLKKNEIVVIGDGENDISMFKVTPNSIAMGNAVDDIKKEANFVTDTNNNDGLAKVLEKILKGQNGNC